MEEITFLVACCIVAVAVYTTTRLVAVAIRGFPVRDVRRWRALAIWCLLPIAWSIVTGPARVAAMRRGDSTFMSPKEQVWRYAMSPERDGQLLWYHQRAWSGGVLSAQQLFAFAWIAVSVVLLFRCRPVGVLYLRHFKSDPGPALTDAFFRAVALGSRAEALRSGDHDTWGLAGSPMGRRWKRGVRRLISDLRVAIVDLTNATPMVYWEVNQLARKNRRAERPTPAVLFVAAESAVVDPKFTPVIRYRGTPDDQLITELREAYFTWVRSQSR